MAHALQPGASPNLGSEVYLYSPQEEEGASEGIDPALNILLRGEGPLMSCVSACKETNSPDLYESLHSQCEDKDTPQLTDTIRQQARKARLSNTKRSFAISLIRWRRQKAKERRLHALRLQTNKDERRNTDRHSYSLRHQLHPDKP